MGSHPQRQPPTMAALEARAGLRPFVRYAIAIGLTVVAVGIKMLEPPGRQEPFSPLFGAVVLAAWIGGRGPAVVSALLATVAVAFVLPPRMSLAPSGADLVRLGTFVIEVGAAGAITVAMKEARARAEAFAERSRRVEEQIRRLYRANRALSTGNSIVVRAADEDELVRETCRAIVEVAGYRMCWIGRAEHDAQRTVLPIAQAGYEEDYLATANITWADTERGRGPVGTAIRTGRPVVIREAATAPSFAPWREDALKRGYASVLAVPIRVEGRLFGALNIYADEIDAFDEGELALLIELADDVAFGITALRARRSAELSRARFESLIMQAPIAVCVYSGPDHVVRLTNPRWRSLRRSVDVSDGKPLREILPGPAGVAVAAVLDEVRATGEPREIAEQAIDYRHPDGVVETRYFNAAFQPLREADGSIDDIIGVISDVTEQVAARRALEEAHAAAEQVSRTKDDFLRIAAHELRTPLTPIVGWAQILLKNGARDAKELQRGLEIIVQSARAEARLVEDLIDVSQITAGKMRMEMRPVDLAAIVGACVEELGPVAAAKGVIVEARIAPEALLSGDAHRLRQVVRALLSNALKFTPRGGQVSVDLSREHRVLDLAVRDTGKGITASELPHVFDAFHSGDPSTTRREGGLGLGMSIVRHIVEAHGGMIRVESAGRGQGATFVAELPALRVERAATPEPAAGTAGRASA